ncbi:unnamed protein product [Linum tenue]|uniref:Uncharacterized protein n=1 Tax=Linum tenue TaxID=586396 RepID=A0AAV0KQM5_9ROSI|nr:unnamed protein product [Linum tenue]
MSKETTTVRVDSVSYLLGLEIDRFDSRASDQIFSKKKVRGWRRVNAKSETKEARSTEDGSREELKVTLPAGILSIWISFTVVGINGAVILFRLFLLSFLISVPSFSELGTFMADPELEAIRQRRMQELMAQRGGGGGGAASQPNPEQQNAQEDAKREAEERRQMMLSQILSAQARERIARIALVKPEKARGVEDVILRAAQMGQIVEKVSEERLISLLEQINTQTSKQTKVTIQRRRSVLDDDD